MTDPNQQPKTGWPASSPSSPEPNRGPVCAGDEAGLLEEPLNPMEAHVSDTLLRLPEVIAQVRLSRSTIYRRIDEGTFPRPRALGAGCVRWRQSEIDAWIEALPVAADPAC